MSNTTAKQHGIARIWRGSTHSENADEYSAYLHEKGVKKLESLGARGVQMFREDAADMSHFMVISYWDTIEAMTSWAGTNPKGIRHLERDKDLLIELPDGVQIMDVVSNNWFLAGLPVAKPQAV